MFSIFVRRFVTGSVGLALMAIGLGLVLTAAGALVVGPLDLMGLMMSADLASFELPARIGWIVIGGSGVIVGSFLLAVAIHVPRAQKVVLIRFDAFPGGGELTMSLQAIRALVSRACLETQGVCHATPDIVLRRRGWSIDCDLTVSDDAELRLLGGAVREHIQKTVERHTGLPVARLRINSALALAGDGRIR